MTKEAKACNIIPPSPNLPIGTMHDGKQCAPGFSQIHPSDCQILCVIHWSREHICTAPEFSGAVLYISPTVSYHCVVCEAVWSGPEALDVQSLC